MDNESFDAFCITYYERIRRYLYSELADPQLALDLTQETKLLQGPSLPPSNRIAALPGAQLQNDGRKVR